MPESMNHRSHACKPRKIDEMSEGKVCTLVYSRIWMGKESFMNRTGLQVRQYISSSWIES